MSDDAILRVDHLDAFHGKSHVLRDVSLELRAGEIVSVLGRNGSGRSTLLKAAMGLVATTGSIRFAGREIARLAPFERARLGLGYVPEAREVFGRLSVENNLVLGRRNAGIVEAGRRPRIWSLDDMYRLFPLLRERRRAAAGVLSGGEQQMLTLCRTLMGNPSSMLVDEPTEGLAPALVEQLAAFLVELRDSGMAILLVEQKLGVALAISQRCHVMGQGRIVFTGSPAQLEADPVVRQEWLEVQEPPVALR